MFCGTCGSEVQATDRFCPKCGQTVSQAGMGSAIPGTTPAPVMGAPAGGYAAPAGYAAPGVMQRRYAGFWLRFVAYLVDGLIVGIPIGIIIFIFIAFFGGLAALHFPTNPNPDPAAAIGFVTALFAALLPIILISWAASWLYFAYFESSERQATLGKSMLGLRVTDKNGQRLSFGHATGRYFSKIITGLVPLAIGWILAGLTEKKQALHDFIAGTLVWRDN